MVFPVAVPFVLELSSVRMFHTVMIATWVAVECEWADLQSARMIMMFGIVSNFVRR